MNHLLAKLRGRNGLFWKVMSQTDTIFDMPDLSTCHDYTPGHMLDDDDWYKLDGFASRGFNNQLVGATFNSTDYNQILPQHYSNISYFCSKQGDHLLFQKMTASHILRKRWFRISEAPAMELDSPIITLHHQVDALYDSTADTLYFRDFAKLAVIFDGIESLYRDATQQEVEQFLANDFITLTSNYSAASVKKANRKRIAVVMDKLNQYSPEDQQTILRNIHPYCPDIVSANDNTTFEISNEEQLKRLLFGIEQRYFTTPVGGERRLANSVQVIS